MLPSLHSPSSWKKVRLVVKVSGRYFGTQFVKIFGKHPPKNCTLKFTQSNHQVFLNTAILLRSSGGSLLSEKEIKLKSV